ncbi:MAG: glycosyltransferase [Verrucomicrobia bacterium]|nr:glycosyltransferase [Verrucomicrobiota bacterium]
MRLSVLIPAHNEAATLGEIVARVRATRLAREIVVVDDGSICDTPRPPRRR